MESQLYFGDSLLGHPELYQEFNQDDENTVSMETKAVVAMATQHQLMMEDIETGAIFNWTKELYGEETHFENFQLCCGRQKSERHFEAEMACHYELSFPLPKDVITIAVDATPTRAGGLLILPKQKQIYFYSVLWNDSFDFFERPRASHEFEMTNAYLAMQLFYDIIIFYRNYPSFEAKNDNLILITDNIFYTRVPYFYNEYTPKWKILLDKMDEKLKEKKSSSSCLRGDWEYGNQRSNVFIYIADRLSREDCSGSLTLFDLGDERLYFLFKEYGFVNLSNETGPILGEIGKELAELDELDDIFDEEIEGDKQFI